MNAKKFIVLGAAAAVLLAAGIFFSTHRASQQADLGGRPVLPNLKESLGEVHEIRLSKGDGSKTTIRRGDAGWTVVERNFPADAMRVRELALALANLRVVEVKTADKANYARLGVEPPDSPTATSTLVEVAAGKAVWSLVVGKGADTRAVYVRKPDEAASLLAEPLLTADPDQKSWIDRTIVDLPGANVRDLSVKLGKAPAYQLARAAQGAEITLSPLPKGSAAASNMVLNGQVEALTAFNFDDVRAAPSPAPAYPDTAVYRTFDGQVIEFAGRREGDKALITVNARRDASLAVPPAPPAPAAAPIAEPKDQTTERLAKRTPGVEFEIPAYKYEAIFKPQGELIDKK